MKMKSMAIHLTWILLSAVICSGILGWTAFLVAEPVVKVMEKTGLPKSRPVSTVHPLPPGSWPPNPSPMNEFSSNPEGSVGNHKAASARYKLGQSLLRVGKIPEAMEAFRDAAQLKPDFLEAHFALGVLLARQGIENHGEAMDQFLEVLRLNPNHVRARINLSNLLEQGGDLEAAIAEMQKAVQLAPKQADFYLLLGQKQQKAKQYQEAIQSYRRSTELNPQMFGAHYGVGVVLYLLGDFAGAATELQSLLELNPDHAYAHYQLGKLLVKQEEFSKAATHLEDAIRLQPTLAEAYAELGALLKRRNETEQAEKAFRNAVRLNPELTKACYGLAQLLLAKGEKEEARKFFDQVQRLKQGKELMNRAASLNADGVDLMNAGRLTEALALFRDAFSMDPSLALAAYNQGVVLARQNKAQEAIEAFRTAIRLRPGFVLSHFGLGFALKMAGDPAAEEEIRKAQLMSRLLPKAGNSSMPSALRASSDATDEN
jgi:protein O-GlcNAc transferase